MDQALILHEDPKSANCYKVRLTAAHVGVELQRKSYNILKGETRTEDFLANVNANGRIPVLQVGDRFISESNAACWYLAEGSELIPDNRYDRADMLRWLFWEQYNHEPNIATVRFWLTGVGVEALNDLQRAQIAPKRKAGNEALELMDRHLEQREWVAADRLTLADLCLFAYTHVADEGGFNLELYPSVIAWLERIMVHPKHVEMF